MVFPRIIPLLPCSVPEPVESSTICLVCTIGTFVPACFPHLAPVTLDPTFLGCPRQTPSNGAQSLIGANKNSSLVPLALFQFQSRFGFGIRVCVRGKVRAPKQRHVDPPLANGKLATSLSSKVLKVSW